MTTPPTSYMPSARSREAPSFKGKNARLFLEEFETYANKAGLDNAERCRILENYCSSEPARFIRTLKSSVRKDWTLLKNALLAAYTSAKEEDRYTYATLDTFTRAKRNIKSSKAYDKYYRQFMSIANPLTEKGKLIESQHNELFFKGLRPGSLRLYVQRTLQQEGKWPKTNKEAPAADDVMQVVRRHLGGDEFEAELSDEQEDSTVKFVEHSSDSSDSSDSSSSEEDEEPATFRQRKMKLPSSSKKSNEYSSTSKEKEADSKDAATEELTKKLERLAIHLKSIDNRLSATSSKPTFTAQQTRVCYMCGQNESHGMKDCPETIAFMASGVVKTNVDGRIIRTDGKPLPRGIPGAGGIAKVLKDELANRKGSTSAAEVEHGKRFVSNYEFAKLDNIGATYTAIPAQRVEKSKDERMQPYRHSERNKERANQTLPEKEIPVKKMIPEVEIPTPPKTILKRQTPAVTQDEDVVMESIPEPAQVPEKKIETPAEVPTAKRDIPKEAQHKVPKEKAKGKVSFEDVEYIEIGTTEKPTKPKRASPAFKFSSEVQESVDQNALLDKVLDQPITLTVREILSSYEVSKRIQAITKSQKIPINYGAEKPIKENSSIPKEKQGAFSARVEEVLDEEFRIATTRSCELDWEENDKKFQLLDSDSDVNTEDEADMYYQALRERDHLNEKEGPFLVAEYEDHKVEVNLALIPKYLAMVTAKITATISGRRSVEMLLDSGSELNIMAQEIQEDLRLPLDPSGASWSLRGIAGQPVNLIGLCRNVQVEIGGFLFPHNFFISKDMLGEKDIIIGQPWLLNQAA